ncbi:MAG: DUF1761 domain-containing protein [Planctomycetia bacterium]|nr:DUF1761 domain-containing protein [Planctomycetia bacterium]
MTFDLSKLNWLAIGLVCVATFFLGAIWYTAFGPLWVKYNGYTPEQVTAMQKARPPAVFFGGMIVSYALFAVFLAIVLQNMPVSGWRAAALAGLVIWLAIAVPIGVTGWIASTKHIGVYVIDLAYQLVFIVGGSIVLSLWRR